MGVWRRMRHALRFGRKPQRRTQDDDNEEEEDGDKNTGKGSKGSQGSEEDGPREVSDILDLASAEVAELVDAHDDENEEGRASNRPHTLVSEKERLEVTDKMFAIVLSIKRTKRVIRGLEEGLETAPEEKRLRRSMMRAQVDALEAKAFAKTKNHGIEAYRTLTASKINTLKEAMLALRERQGRLLKDVGRKVDQSHLHAKLGRLEGDNWSRVDFLRRVMLLQARVRGFLARRRMSKLRSAVRTLQSIVRLRKRCKAANRIQALQRRRSARRIADQRLGAILTLQRFLVANNAIAEAQDAAHDLRLALAMRERAADQLQQNRLLGSALHVWATNCRERKHVRALLLRCIEKWVLQRLAHAFKNWFASSRRSFEIRNITGHRILQESKGCRLPMVNLYKDHFVPSSLDEQRPRILRESWRHMTLLQNVASDPPRSRMSDGNPSDQPSRLMTSERNECYSEAAKKAPWAESESSHPETRTPARASRQDDINWFLPQKMKRSKDVATRRLHQTSPQLHSLLFESLAHESEGATRVFTHLQSRQQQIEDALIEIQKVRDRYAFRKIVRHADALTPRSLASSS